MELGVVPALHGRDARARWLSALGRRAGSIRSASPRPGRAGSGRRRSGANRRPLGCPAGRSRVLRAALHALADDVHLRRAGAGTCVGVGLLEPLALRRERGNLVHRSRRALRRSRGRNEVHRSRRGARVRSRRRRSLTRSAPVAARRGVLGSLAIAVGLAGRRTGSRRRQGATYCLPVRVLHAPRPGLRRGWLRGLLQARQPRQEAQDDRARSRSTTSRAPARRSPSCARSATTSPIRASTRRWARRRRAACCSWGRPAPARR